MDRYLQGERRRLAPHSVTLKAAHLNLFAEYFKKLRGRGSVHRWTPKLSRFFRLFLCRTRPGSKPRSQKFVYLQQDPRPDHMEYAPATLNRILSTLRRFSRWLHRHHPFPDGDPMAKIVGERLSRKKQWRSLRREQVRWLTGACEQRLKTCQRKDQNPWMEGAVFHLLLETGLREGELAQLDLRHVGARGLVQVERGTDRWDFPLSATARSWLDQYIKRRGRVRGALFRARTGNRLRPLDVNRICGRIAEEAFRDLPTWRHFTVNPQILRYTYLTRVAQDHGVEAAHEASGTAWKGGVESLGTKQPRWSDEEEEILRGRMPW